MAVVKASRKAENLVIMLLYVDHCTVKVQLEKGPIVGPLVSLK